MARRTAEDARTAIVEAARHCFAAAGFRGTSLADIAAETGCAKATLLYHFDSKEAILAELVTPLWAQMESLAADLERLDDADAQREAISRMTAIGLAFRSELGVFYGEIPELLSSGLFEGAKEASDAILHALVHRSDAPGARIVAVVVVAGIAAACHEYNTAPRGTLRAAIAHVMRNSLEGFAGDMELVAP